jgi:CRISPR-associated protein Csx14
MTTASIPVELFNPGQVLASLGFLEATGALGSRAAGGFDWTDGANARFMLEADGERNPFERVLEFLSKAELHRIAPQGYEDPPQKEKKSKKATEGEEDVLSDGLVHSDCFPARQPDPMTLPARLTHSGQSLNITHWADGSSRNDFKLYAGNRSAAQIARAMLMGTREKPRKGQKAGELRTKGINTLWKEDPGILAARPFDVLTPMGGSFNFDPRGAWTALDAGYSPNDQKHSIAASPVVELLAAIGLEHARPLLEVDREEKLVRYAAWGELLSPLLARAALSGCRFGVPLRMFKFKFALSGKNKVVNFAEGEI